MFDDYPNMIWTVRPTKMVEAKTYPLTNQGAIEAVNPRTFTITLTANTPFAKTHEVALEDFGIIDEAMERYLLGETGFISESRMPPLDHSGLQNTSKTILLYNPGNEDAPVKIHIAGDVGEDGIYLYNKTTNQGCKFVNILAQDTTDVDVYVEADSEYGTVYAIGPGVRESAYQYHDDGYIHLAGGYPVERGLRFSYDGNEREITCLSGFSEDMVGKYVYLTALWVKIERIISPTVAEINTTLSHSGTEVSDIVTMNEIVITGSSGTNLSKLEFQYKPTFS